MKYGLLIYSQPTPLDPAAQGALGAAYMGFSQDIIDSGEMVGGDPLEAATSGRVRDGRVATTPGPVVASENVLSGYYIVDVMNLDRALELAARIPDALTGAVEVHPLGSIPDPIPNRSDRSQP